MRACMHARTYVRMYVCTSQCVYKRKMDIRFVCIADDAFFKSVRDVIKIVCVQYLRYNLFLKIL